MKSQKIQPITLALPKGGGAKTSLGETFQPNEFSGTAHLSIPIHTSQCRDFTPNLTFSYSSGNGNGVWGMGFDLSLPNISRRTRLGTPRYNNQTFRNEQDVFLFNGQELVPSSAKVSQRTENNQDFNVQQYYPRKEEDFDLIEFWSPINATQDPGFWKVTSRDHIVSIFGKSETAVIANPSDKNEVFTWLLEEMYNSTGDHHIYLYKAEDTNNISQKNLYAGHISTANKYLQKILYGNIKPSSESLLMQKDPSATDPSQWHFEIVFDYGEYNIEGSINNPYQSNKDWNCRPDPFSSYNAGFEIRTYRRCQSVLMFHRFEAELGKDPILVHSTSFNYTNGYSQISQCVSVSETGHYFDIKKKSYQSKSLPSIDFSYTLFDPNNSKFKIIANTLTRLDGDGFSIIDLFGEGVPGVLFSDERANFYAPPASDKNGTIPGSFKNFDSLDSSPPLSMGENGQGTFLQDVTGNAMLDLVVTGDGLRGYWEAQPDHSWKPFQNFVKWPADFNAPGRKWVDLTGDGIADLVQFTQEGVNYYPNLRSKGFGSAMVQKIDKVIPLANSPSQTELLVFTDIAGSGQDHLTKIKSGEIQYWPNLSFGRFGGPITIDNAPQIENFNVERLRLVDLDGSGGVDLLYFYADKVSIYFNHNGNTLSSPVDLNFPNGLTFDQLDEIIFSDVYGNGNQCLILLERHTSDNRFWCYDFCNGEKPYLLNKIINNLGASTDISYKSSVHCYLADKENGLPWVTSLPMPVQVVSEIINTDLISNATNTITYDYHHGFYDTVEREFRGFGRVDRQEKELIQLTNSNKDIETPYVAPRKSITWYHTGAYLEESQLRDQFKKEYFNKDSEAFELVNDVFEWEQSTPDEETKRQESISLSGTIIRSEFYDQSPDNTNSDVPISVTESNFTVDLKQAKSETTPYAVFFTVHRETLESLYECDKDDPRISYEGTLEVDKFGNVSKSIELAYPRRVKNKPLDQQKEIKLLCHTHNYFNQETPDEYLLGVKVESKSYEVNPSNLDGTKLISFDDLKNLIKSEVDPLTDDHPSSKNAILRAWEQIIYKDPKSRNSLDFGKVGLPVLAGSNQVAAFEGDEIKSVFEDAINTNDLNELLKSGGYFQQSSNQIWWNPGLTQSFSGLDHFYLVQEVQDVKGNKTSYIHDQYSLIPESSTDPLQNVVKYQSIDYQHLSALKLLDINFNSFEVRLDPLGRVVYSSFYGTEGDETAGFSPLDQIPEAANPTFDDIIKQPGHYLDKAQSFFFYDFDSWKKSQSPAVTLQVTAQEYPSVIQEGQDILADVKSEIKTDTKSASSVHWSVALFRKIISGLKTLHSKLFKSGKDKATAIKLTEAELSGTDEIMHEVLEDLPHLNINYFDGFGRPICSKKNAEDGPALAYDPSTKKISSNDKGGRWLTSGYTVRVSSGKVIQHFEPFYIDTADFVPDESLKNYGVSDTLYYDSQNRVIQSLTAKGFLSFHQWTPWSELISDANDTLEQSPYFLANVSKSDPNSPYKDESLTDEAKKVLQDIAKNFNQCATQNILDNQGHTIIHQQKLVIDDPDTSETLETHFTYDILGRQLTSADPRLSSIADKYNFKNTYNLAGEKIHTVSADSGKSWTLNDVFGNPLWASNDRKVIIRTYYDELHRPLAKHVTSTSDTTKLNQVVEYMVYGDAQDVVASQDKNNLRGKVVRHYDQAGLLSISGYNLLGKPLTTSRRFNLDGKNESNWGKVFSDISISKLQQLEKTILQNQSYDNTLSYDALGRTTSEVDADGNILIPTYHLSGWLNQVTVNTKDDDGTIDSIKGINWNAKGQKISAVYGNGTQSSYAYDPWTFELSGIKTTDSNKNPIQDLSYQYDPIGNVIFKTDNSQDVVFHNNAMVKPEGTYVYDSLHRLISATGREKAGESTGSPSDIPILSPASGANDNQALEKYTEKYKYDLGGNLTNTTHTAKKTNWSREMVQAEFSNRSVISTLKGSSTTVTRSDVDSFFDPCGNPIKTQSISPLEWNYRNNLWKVTTVKRKDGASDGEYYVYDGAGNRVRKIKVQYGNAGTTSLVKETIYLGNLEIRKTYDGSKENTNPTEERHSLKIPGGDSVVATRDWWLVGAPPKGIDKIFLRYHLSDKLKSCTIEIDKDGQQISKEEYSPYGSSTLFIGSKEGSGIKNYRYGGKERDSVTGFYYYGARYYAPWLCRWISTDPAGTIDGLNLYAFVTNNPTTHVDIGGMARGKKRSKPGDGSSSDDEIVDAASTPVRAAKRARVVTHQSDLGGNSKAKGKGSLYSDGPTGEDKVKFTKQSRGVMAILKINGEPSLFAYNGKALEEIAFEDIGTVNQQGKKKNPHSEDWITESFREKYERGGEAIPERKANQVDKHFFSLRISSSPCTGCVETIINFKRHLEEIYGEGQIVLRVKFKAPYDLPSSLKSADSEKAKTFIGVEKSMSDAGIPFRIMPAKSVTRMNPDDDGSGQGAYLTHIASLNPDTHLGRTWGDFGVSRKMYA